MRSTSWRQHTATRMRVCAHGDRQKVPDGVIVEEQQHMPLLSLYSSRQGDSTQLLACMDTCTTTNKTYPVASPRRGSSTSCPQGRRSASCTPVHTQHAKATAHSCSYACMRTRRRASRTRLRRRGGAAAHAAPKYILGTSWRQHTAARVRVCVHDDKQDVPGCVVVEEQQHTLLPGE